MAELPSRSSERAMCPRCQGIGKVVSAHVQKCAACDGTGSVSTDYVAGYDEGKRIGHILGTANARKAIESKLEELR